MVNIDKAKEAFDKYVSGFDMNDDMVKLKYNHTYRVCEQSVAICKSIGLDEENTKLAYLIALLHDIGRFVQIKNYKTFSDSRSLDHADFGCELLFQDGLIRKFVDTDEYDNIIWEAIYYHNKYDISPWLTDEKALLHSKIIRDADKIDIIYDVVGTGEIKLPEDDNGISTKVTDDFYDEKLIHHTDKKTKNDSTMLMLSFIYDLNFDYSYEYWKDHKYINKIYKKLKNKELFEPYIEKANGFIEGKCKDVKHKILT